MTISDTLPATITHFRTPTVKFEHRFVVYMLATKLVSDGVSRGNTTSMLFYKDFATEEEAEIFVKSEIEKSSCLTDYSGPYQRRQESYFFQPLTLEQQYASDCEILRKRLDKFIISRQLVPTLIPNVEIVT
jgi:hypothetical protein